jgi:hypothetical protein
MDQKEIDHAQILNTISQIEDKYIDNHSYVGKKMSLQIISSREKLFRFILNT